MSALGTHSPTQRSQPKPRGPARAEFVALTHLTLRQRYLPVRQVIGYSTFVRIVVAAALLSIAGSGIAGSLAVLVASALGQPPARLAAAVLLVQGYLGLGLVLREVVTERRRLVCSPAEVGFYRALDVTPRLLFFAASALPTSIPYAALTLASWMAAARLDGLGLDRPIPTLVRLLPLVLWLVSIALAAWCAHTPINEPRRPQRTGQTVGALAALTVLAVWALTWALDSLPQMLVEVGSGGVSAALAALTFVGVSAGGRLAVSLRRLDQPRTPLWQLGGAALGDPRLSPGASRWRRMTRLAGANAAYPMVRRIVTLTVGLAGLAAALRSAGLVDRVAPHWWEVARPMLSGWILVTAVLVTGLLFGSIGPTALAAVHRYEWENGNGSARRIAGEAAVVLLAPVLLVGVAFGTIDAMLTGALSPSPIVVSIAAVGAALVAEAAVRPRSRVDGSTSSSWLMGVIVCVAIAPSMILPTATDLASGLAKSGYALVLFLGGVEWTARRIAPSSR